MKVGVVLSQSSTADDIHRYAETRALALQAERAGFDSLWVFDHIFLRRPSSPTVGSWEGWTLLTALAEATERVELGSLVLGAPFRNPVLLAKMATSLDEISSGRLILGLGAGWHEPEFEAMGIPFDARVDRFHEVLQIVVPLLRQGKVTFRGRYHRAINAELVPRGPRADGPPILVAALRPRMLRLAAQYADLWNTAWYGHPDEGLQEAEAGAHRACVEVGRDPATLPTTVGVAVAYPGGEGDGGRGAGALSGTPEEVARGLQSFAVAGAAHLICRLEPTTAESLDYLSQALAPFRSLSGET